ncbi:MAG: hypothetical protein AAFX56_09380 [Pseudomonadota bacterium]
MKSISLGANDFTVTLAFFFGTLGIELFIMAAVFVSGGPAADVGSGYWLRVMATTAGIAGMCGLLVDCLRLLANRYWTKKPKFRIKLKKILKTHLA